MIALARAIVNGYDRFWLAPSSGTRAGLFRIAFGIYLLGYLLALAPHVTLLFSREGVYVPYLVPDLAPAAPLAWLLFCAMVVLNCALIAGFYTELAALFLLALYMHHYTLQLAVKQSSFERLIIIELAALCLASAGLRLGLDGARLRKRGLLPQPTVWLERVVAVQTVFLYSGSGLWKLLNPAWHTGELLHSTFQGMWATPLAFEITQLGLHHALWTLGSWLVILLELSLGPLLIARRTRHAAVVVATLFHIGNCVLLFIPEFLVCVPALLVFVDEALLERVVARVRSMALRATAKLRKGEPGGAA
jgi:hypothetical protein